MIILGKRCMNRDKCLGHEDNDLVENLYCYYKDSEDNLDFTLMDSKILYAYVECKSLYTLFLKLRRLQRS